MPSRCASCGYVNVPDMYYCGKCGAPLAQKTAGAKKKTQKPHGASPDAPDSLAGGYLAERLREAGLAARGQRRNVTVLFADLPGYNAYADKIDAEDLVEFVQQSMQMMSNTVRKYEGSVDEHTGDGLMALFGAPISYENNAERALRAALDMQHDLAQLNQDLAQRFGIEINARIGLHSGPVVVGDLGSDQMMDFAAVGDTVDLAQRVKDSAPVGSILISESVYRQVRTVFDCQQVSVLNPKGIARPVAAYRVAGAKSMRGLLRGLEGLHAPMIGRDQELLRLKQAANQLVETRQGQFVVVSGEAGLGKSRLAAEFIEWIDPREIRILQGHSLAYRRMVPYWIIREVIYSYLGLSSMAPVLQVSRQLAHLATIALHLKAQRMLPFIENLLSIPYSDPIGADLLKHLDPRQLRQQTYLSVRDLFIAEASDRPLLIILDDLHWVDEASLELLSFLMKSIPQAPIFVLAISRSADVAGLDKTLQWAEQNLGERFEHIELHSLSRHQSARLLSLLLSTPDMPEKLREQILERSAGIPFYLEEILRMLIDEGIIQQEAGSWRVVAEVDLSKLGVPHTLQELVTTRFDRLDRLQKSVIQVAAVIGKTFGLPVLSGVLRRVDPQELQATIDLLVERDFIAPLSGSLEREYTFRHILSSDAIYNMLLRKERRVLHGQVGDVIESLYADRLEEQVELLANHYRWSNKLDHALRYLVLAGQKASRNSLNEQAHQQFEAALEILPKVEHTLEQVYQAHMGMGDALAFAGEYPQGREHFYQALQAIDEMDAAQYAEARSGLYRKIARTFERQGDYEQALAQLALAQNALDAWAQPCPIERAEVWNDIGWIHFRRGNFTEARDLFLQALELVEVEKAYRVVASIYNRLGGVAYYQGDWDQAASYLKSSIEIRNQIDDIVGLASSTNNLGNLEIEMGEFDNALDYLKRNFELVSRLGQVEGIAVAYNNLGWLYTLRGETDEAQGALIKALQMAHQIGYTSLVREVTKNIGELYLALEDWAQARAALSEVAPAFEELGANDQLLHVYRLLGETALGAGDLEAAQHWARQLDGVVAKYGDDTLELPTLHWGELLRFQGMLAIARQDWLSAERYLQVSVGVFEKLRSRLYLGRSFYQLGKLATACGEHQEAERHYQKALQIFQQIGAKLDACRAEQAMQALKTFA